MLYMPNCALFDSEEAVLSPAAHITAEGQALVATPEGLKESTGTAGEVFAGFAVQRVSATLFLENYFVGVEELTVATAGSLILQREPLSGDVVGIVNVATGAVIEGETTVDGATISNDNLTEGLEVRVTYKYAMSVVEAKSRMGDVQPGGASGVIVGQIGLCSRGTIYTNCFDTSKNWAAATEIKLAANGMLTDQTGTGTAIKAYVVATPTSMYPYLGVKFSAA